MGQAVKRVAGNISVAVAILVAVLMVAPVPGNAQQSAVPGPTIVQSLDDAREDDAMITAVTGTFIGAATSTIFVNMITGGVTLTPVIGLQASNVLGGSWLAAIGSAPVAGDMLVHTVTTAVVAFGGGLAGNFFASD